ncbi:hypothetical protein ABT346_20470 [Micromonospora peucetia]|uniref:hypothetical protein n=1 Tax=Micromonospora peucetia TaxID=47871 RepID=UPI003331CEF9
MAALTNVVPAARAGIAAVLLDDGADARVTSADGVNTLHAMLGSAALDPAFEAPVLRRPIDGGADVNGVAEESGTPLQVLMAQFRYTDEVLAPFYDVLFSYSHLDLLKIGAYDKSAYAMAVKSGRRPALRLPTEQHLRVWWCDGPARARIGRGQAPLAGVYGPLGGPERRCRCAPAAGLAPARTPKWSAAV